MAKNAKPTRAVALSDQQVIDALNSRPDTEKVTAENLWNECRAKEVGHRSCKCGKQGCGNAS